MQNVTFITNPHKSQGHLSVQCTVLVTDSWHHSTCPTPLSHILTLPVSFPLGQRQNTALPNRGGIHLPVRPRQPLAKLQASLHVVRDAQGWRSWMASPSQVSPAHLNCRFSLFLIWSPSICTIYKSSDGGICYNNHCYIVKHWWL